MAQIIHKTKIGQFVTVSNFVGDPLFDINDSFDGNSIDDVEKLIAELQAGLKVARTIPPKPATKKDTIYLQSEDMIRILGGLYKIVLERPLCICQGSQNVTIAKYVIIDGEELGFVELECVDGSLDEQYPYRYENSVYTLKGVGIDKTETMIEEVYVLKNTGVSGDDTPTTRNHFFASSNDLQISKTEGGVMATISVPLSDETVKNVFVDAIHVCTTDVDGNIKSVDDRISRCIQTILHPLSDDEENEDEEPEWRCRFMIAC